MGLFDWFQPDPPVRCLNCESGVVKGWQEKHSEQGLFVWQQGQSAPVDQPIDSDCRIDEAFRDERRLPKNEALSIYYGDCDSCGATFPFHLPLSFTGDTWTGFGESRTVKYGEQIRDGWLQCPLCSDILELSGTRQMVTCPSCQVLLLQS